MPFNADLAPSDLQIYVICAVPIMNVHVINATFNTIWESSRPNYGNHLGIICEFYPSDMRLQFAN